MDDQKKKKVAKNTREWLKYSSMAMQMGLIMLCGWYIGSWIDGRLQLSRPAFGVALLLLFFFAYIYRLVKSLG